MIEIRPAIWQDASVIEFTCREVAVEYRPDQSLNVRALMHHQEMGQLKLLIEALRKDNA